MYWNYLKAVLRHKWYVFLAGLKLEVPLYLLILHDISKFSLKEFHAYAENFYGKGKNKDEYDYAWVHHQNHNKHHWQYWILVYDNEPDKVVTLPMPYKYLIEMLADWMGAGRAYNKDWKPEDTKKWYLKNKDNIILHPLTRYVVELYLRVI